MRNLQTLKQQHSTRNKYKYLPKYVYRFPNANSKKRYRVCRKINGETVTLGYFRLMKDAKQFVLENFYETK